MGNKLRIVILGLVFLVSLVLIYLNHFDNGFHFDDTHTIEENLFIRDIKNIPLFFKDVKTFSTLASHQNYRPVVTSTLAIDYYFGGGLKPFWFHLSTFIWFILQCVLIFFLYKKFISYSINQTINPSINRNFISFTALLTTAFYAFHTSNAETLNYIISRSDLLSTVGVVASLFIYVVYPNKRKYYLYLIPLVFGILSKETAVTFAGLLFFYVLFFESKSQNIISFDNIINALKKSSVSIICCAVLAFLNIQMMSDEYVSGGTRFNYIITQPYVMLLYFFTFILPIHLSADTDVFAFESIYNYNFYWGIIFLMIMLWLVYYFSKIKELRVSAYGIIWFFIALLPTSSIIPLSEVLNDHRIFYPFIGLSLSLGNLLVYLYNKHYPKISTFNPLLIAILMLIYAGHSYGVIQRNKVWNDEESLWYDVSIKSPKNGRGLMNYGLTQMSKGDYQTAEKYFQEALIYNPYYSYLYINMGILKNAQGKSNEAEYYLKKSVELDPSYYGTHYYYANFLYKQNRLDEAINYYKKAVELSPYFLYSRHELMNVYLEKQMWNELYILTEETLKIAPDDKISLSYLNAAKEKQSKLEQAEKLANNNPTPENYLNLSLEYYYAAKYRECIDVCKKAIKLKPDFAEAYNNICTAYNALEEWKLAEENCKKALSIKPDFELAKGNLNVAIKNQENK